MGQTVESVAASTQPLDDGFGFDRPIGQIVTEGQHPSGQPVAAAAVGQIQGGQAAGPMGTLGSWDVLPVPSIDPAAGQSSAVSTWILADADAGSSREK